MNKTFAKRVAALGLCAILLLAASCSGGSQETTSSAVDVYRSIAQEFIDAGDYDSAIQTLEEGIAATNSESLIALLEEVKNAQATQLEDGEPNQEETDSPAGDSAEVTDEPVEPTDETADTTTAEPSSSTPSTEQPAEVTGPFDHLVGNMAG